MESGRGRRRDRGGRRGDGLCGRKSAVIIDPIALSMNEFGLNEFASRGHARAEPPTAARVYDFNFKGYRPYFALESVRCIGDEIPSRVEELRADEAPQ